MWFLVDDAIVDAEELLAIPARYENAALGLWTKIGAWMAKHGQHFIPFTAVKKLRGTQLLCDYLADAGLLEWDVQNGARGLLYTGQGCSVRAPEDVQKARKATAERVRKHREKKRNGVGLREKVDVTPLPVTPVTPSPGLVRNGVVTNQPPLPSQAELLRKSGTVLARPSDSMGRPSMDLARLAGHEPSLPERPPPDRRIPAEARELLKAALPSNVYRNQKTRWGLETEVATLLNGGAEPGDVRETLDVWLQTADVYPGHLGHMHTELLKRRNGPLQGRDSGHSTLSSVDNKTLGWLQKGRE